jgi:SAM-dependent methyltransferase
MDQNIEQILLDNLNIEFIDMILSNPGKSTELIKVKIRPVLIKGELLFQSSEYMGKQIFHKNHLKEDLMKQLTEWLDDTFKQVLLRTNSKQITMMISKKGKVTVKSKSISEEIQVKTKASLSHNREKVYIITEGRPVPFLVDLGVMTSEGKIINQKYDKFKQINRFLEFIEDILPNLNKEKELTILDFGCGKSYLTFAMYYYLKELKGYNIKVIGLDLKKEVIKNCNELAERYNYSNLKFLEGDIASYNGVNSVDMVVTLHACDTATDYALFKAVQWNADVILSVPCCQHELNSQINNEILEPILQYGLIKERIAALATDAFRAELLEVVGYKTQILEFIDMEHTPKNILLRAVKRSQTEMNRDNFQISDTEKLMSYKTCKEFLGVDPTFYKLLADYYPIS